MCIRDSAWALTNIKGTKNFDTFLDIFVQTDSSGFSFNPRGLTFSSSLYPLPLKR